MKLFLLIFGKWWVAAPISISNDDVITWIWIWIWINQLTFFDVVDDVAKNAARIADVADAGVVVETVDGADGRRFFRRRRRRRRRRRWGRCGRRFVFFVDAMLPRHLGRVRQRIDIVTGHCGVKIQNSFQYNSIRFNC